MRKCCAITTVIHLKLTTMQTIRDMLFMKQHNFMLYHFHLIQRSRYYDTTPTSFHLHVFNIFFVSGTTISCTCWPVNIRIAEKQIVSATSKYRNSSWYYQRKNALEYQSPDGAKTYIFPKYAPRQHVLFAIWYHKSIVENIPAKYKDNKNDRHQCQSTRKIHHD